MNNRCLKTPVVFWNSLSYLFRGHCFLKNGSILCYIMAKIGSIFGCVSDVYRLIKFKTEVTDYGKDCTGIDGSDSGKGN